MQVPYSICPEIQKADNLWKDKIRCWTNVEKTMRIKRSRNNRGGGVQRPHTYVGINTAKI